MRDRNILRAAAALLGTSALSAGCYVGLDAVGGEGRDTDAMESAGAPTDASAGGEDSSGGPPDRGGDNPGGADADQGNPTLWRLNAAQYRNTVATMFLGRDFDSVELAEFEPLSGVYWPFSSTDSGTRFSTNASRFSIADGEFLEAVAAAQRVAEAWVAWSMSREESCFASDADLLGDCFASAVRNNGALLFRRPLSAEEVQGYVDVAQSVAEDGQSQVTAAETGLQALLLAPPFLFRTELGESGNSTSPSELTDYEVAAALSYSLLQRPPDTELYQAASDGLLDDPALVEQHLRRLVSDPREAAGLRAFFLEYLPLVEARGAAKDDNAYPFHDEELLADDAAAWVDALLREHVSDELWKHLLTSSEYVAGPETAESYGLDAASFGEEPMLVDLAGERAGLVTHPAFLIAFSQPDHNDPTKRGRFIRESLLCQSVPELDASEIPPLPDLGEDVTLREKLEQHRSDPNCATCHVLMDPIGFGLEDYDHVGRVRLEENGAPVNDEGELVGAGPDADGIFHGGVELASALARSEVVERCLTQHAFEYFMGREPVSERDQAAIDEAYETYKAEGGDMVALLGFFFSSESFRYRIEGQE